MMIAPNTKAEAMRLAAWLNEGAWHQMTLGDVESAGRLLRSQSEKIDELTQFIEKAKTSHENSGIQKIDGWTLVPIDVLNDLYHSINGNRFMGEDWEKKAISSMMPKNKKCSMTAAHTPGPWKTNTAGSAKAGLPFKITEIYVYAPGTQDDTAICGDVIDPVTQEPSESNARLIAAAPDLGAIIAKIGA